MPVLHVSEFGKHVSYLTENLALNIEEYQSISVI